MISLDHVDFTRIHASFPEMILKRGWNYYLDRVVSDLTFENATLRAIVGERARYRVEIELQDFPASTCTCHDGDYCKHMAAVLFEALDQGGRSPTELLRPLAKKQPAHFPKESDSVADWPPFFASVIKMPAYNGPYTLDTYVNNGKATLLPLSQGWDLAKKSLYRLHVWLYLMQGVDEIHEQAKGRYLHYDKRWMLEIQQLLENLNQPRIQEKYEPDLLSTIEYLSQHAFPAHDTITDWSAIYGSVWAHLLAHEPWLQAERHRVQAELEQELGFTTAPPEPIRKKSLHQALLHLEIIMGDDRHAMELADAITPALQPSWFFPYLRSFGAQERWSRLTEWLNWMQPKMQSLPPIEQVSYLSFWRQLYERGELAGQAWEQILVDLLPNSFTEYARTLLEHEQYQGWVDLHLFYEVELTALKSEDVKKVEAANLAYMFPLYHQAAERYILEKNRPSYKRSVRYLKKLKTRYKKLKDQLRWDRYIETLSNKYKRYRAFQEELRKGKLIP